MAQGGKSKKQPKSAKGGTRKASKTPARKAAANKTAATRKAVKPSGKRSTAKQAVRKPSKAPAKRASAPKRRAGSIPAISLTVPEKMVGGIPALGYGTWTLNGQAATEGVLWALEAGYRHIDTAQGYRNEAEVGAAIAQSGIARSEIFITTKVDPLNYGKGKLRGSVEESLKKLGVEQVDLLLLHWPSPNEEFPLPVYARQLADVQKAGLTRRIGVSNFTIRLIDEALQIFGPGGIATNQIEIHPFLANKRIVAHCRMKGIPLTAYCPLARKRILGNPVIEGIARAHGATAAQVSLAFLLAEGFVAIPCSSNRERILENFKSRDLKLDDDEIAQLRGLDRGLRLVLGNGGPDWDPA
jgi:2,5-diketo-D-gluconate reductase B